MKNVISNIGVSAAAMFLFGMLPIQAQEAAKANIPFSFHSNLAAYQSGTYVVESRLGSSSALTLTNSDTGKTTFVPTSSALSPTDKSVARGPVMIFKCDGSCYLTEVWTSTKGYAVPHAVINEEASTTRIVALVRATR
jgi:hypothetical protein